MALRRTLKLVQPSHNAVTIMGGRLKDMKGKKVKSETVIFENCDNMQPFNEAPTFPNAQRVVLQDCHKEFPFYWLRKDNFPDLQAILFDSSPGQPLVLHRFCSRHPGEQVPMFISDRFENYYIKWGWFMNKRMSNLVLVPDEEMKVVIENFKSED